MLKTVLLFCNRNLQQHLLTNWLVVYETLQIGRGSLYIYGFFTACHPHCFLQLYCKYEFFRNFNIQHSPPTHHCPRLFQSSLTIQAHLLVRDAPFWYGDKAFSLSPPTVGLHFLGVLGFAVKHRAEKWFFQWICITTSCMLRCDSIMHGGLWSSLNSLEWFWETLKSQISQIIFFYYIWSEDSIDTADKI